MPKLTIFAEESAPKEAAAPNEKPATEAKANYEDMDAHVLGMTGAKLVQILIERTRKTGATRKSLNALNIEYHQLTKQYPIPHLPAQICLDKFHQVVKEALEKGTKVDIAKEQGRIAYCGLLPKLINRESIRDFITCIVQGMSLGIIPGADGTRLLYGAQIAQTCLPPKKKWRKDPTKTNTKTTPKCPQTAPKQPSNSSEPTPNQPDTVN